jgi:hypothetical protein
MFHFLRSLFTRKEQPYDADPLVADDDPVIETRRSRVLDIRGMLSQASTRVPLGRLLRWSRKAVNLLSRDKIDDLINRAVRTIVDKYRVVDLSSTTVPQAQIAAEARQEFDSLLAQYLRSAQDGGESSKQPFEIVTGNPRPELSFDRMDLDLGRGLHVGTVNLVASAKIKGSGELVYVSERNAFLDVLADESTRKLMRQLAIGYISQGNEGYIVGEAALGLGRIFGKTPRRPMKNGTLSPDEPVALFILSLLVRQLLGLPRKEGEICVYSVPADPVDTDRNYIYHRGALETTLKSLGYQPRPMVESHLIVSSELKDQDYTGIGVSCGAGMFNVGVAYKGVPALNFSTSRGGDWVDDSVAQALGEPADKVREIKEGMDLRKPQGRMEGAIAIYYRHLLQYTVETMRQKFSDTQNMPNFVKAVPIVCAGGASQIPGFLELFKEELEKSRGFPVKIEFIRMAREPMRSVAKGCLQAALEEMSAWEEPEKHAAPTTLERAAVSGTPKKGLPSLANFRKAA